MSNLCNGDPCQEAVDNEKIVKDLDKIIVDRTEATTLLRATIPDEGPEVLQGQNALEQANYDLDTLIEARDEIRDRVLSRCLGCAGLSSGNCRLENL